MKFVTCAILLLAASGFAKCPDGYNPVKNAKVFYITSGKQYKQYKDVCVWGWGIKDAPAFSIYSPISEVSDTYAKTLFAFAFEGLGPQE